MFRIRIPLTLLVLLWACSQLHSQLPVASIVTSNTTEPTITYSNVKGAAQSNSNGVLASLWDSIGTSFTVKYNFGNNNARTLVSFNVTGYPRAFINVTSNAMVRVRRLGNSFVNSSRDHFNFWSVHAAVPANLALTGTFNITGPEVTSQETALLSNNINSGYDNIFQNTINNLHAGNIERIDFITPTGVKPQRQFDVDNAGVLIMDRGTGDPFKIAAITSLDANNDPSAFGPLVSVTASQFGPDLLASPFSYTIFIHDPKFGTVSRPSSTQTQNMRGVFLTFSNLGITPGQRVYGYALFGPDVTTAALDWTTYPNNTNGSSQLDAVNVMSYFADPQTLLPVSLSFEVAHLDEAARVAVTCQKKEGLAVIERSSDAVHFSEAGTLSLPAAGKYYFTDIHPYSGVSYYRIRTTDEKGKAVYSVIKSLRMDEDGKSTVSPNPARERVSIRPSPRFSAGSAQIEVFDASGRRVYQSMLLHNDEQEIPLKGWKPGSYFIKLTDRHSRYSEVSRVAVTL